MPLQTAIPILAFLDLQETVKFYQRLGFHCNDNWKEYLMCGRDKIEIHLSKCDDPEIPKNTGCYINVTEVDALYVECQKLDIIHPDGQLTDKPWEMRQFSIIDNSGNIIHFGQDISK
jgi:hypothetical protein